MAEDKNIKKLEGALEAILFTMGDSVELEKLAKALQTDTKTTKKVIASLMETCEKEDRGVRVVELNGAYQMSTKPELYEYLIRVASQPKRQVLTETLLETLSIIAYKQPVTKLEIEKVRGVKSDHAVNKLVEYELICEVGRLDAPGRPILFGTTEEFLRRFGLRSPEELPQVGEENMSQIREEVVAEVALKLQDSEEQEKAEAAEETE